MRNLLLGTSAAWLGFTVAIATPALADQVTQSDSLNLDSGSVAAGGATTSVGANLSFAGFNSALGTLTGVNVKILNSSDSITGRLSFSSSASGDYYAEYIGWEITYAILGNIPAGDINANIPSGVGGLNCAPMPNPGSCTAGPTMFSNTGAPGLSDTVLSYYESAFMLNAGLGFGNGAAAAFVYNPMSMTSSMAPSGTYTINTAAVDAKWSGTVQVTYTYTPSGGSPGTSVPEPASIALFGSALSLFGLMARHRHRRRDG